MNAIADAAHTSGTITTPTPMAREQVVQMHPMGPWCAFEATYMVHVQPQRHQSGHLAGVCLGRQNTQKAQLIALALASEDDGLAGLVPSRATDSRVDRRLGMSGSVATNFILHLSWLAAIVHGPVGWVCVTK